MIGKAPGEIPWRSKDSTACLTGRSVEWHVLLGFTGKYMRYILMIMSIVCMFDVLLISVVTLVPMGQYYSVEVT